MAVVHVKFHGGERISVVNDDAGSSSGSGALGELVPTGNLAKKRTAPPHRAQAPTLTSATELAITRANHASARLEAAKASGNPFELDRARRDGFLIKHDLERAKREETTLASIREAMARPIRIF